MEHKNPPNRKQQINPQPITKTIPTTTTKKKENKTNNTKSQNH